MSELLPEGHPTVLDGTGVAQTETAETLTLPRV